VTIWENLGAQWSWQAPAGGPADEFAAPAIAFTRLPAKYNARGIEVDRSSPFALHAETTVQVAEGVYQMVLRSRNAARLFVDGRQVAETAPLRPNSAGHEHVPELAREPDARWRILAPGDKEELIEWTSDGAPHRIELWVLIGEKRLRHETGELSVSLAALGDVPRLLGLPQGQGEPITDLGWLSFVEHERARVDALDTLRRHQAAASESGYWQMRHDLARDEAAKSAPSVPPGEGNVIDRVLAAAWKDAGVQPAPLADDAAFFRRLALDTIGTLPEPAEVEAFLADSRPEKRARAIDARLVDPRWADGWMGYWLDVLAENPGILKPTLNNTGPFRKYVYTALLDNTPFDRFATELVRMEGSALGGGPAGFGVATQNDAPMAARAHVLAKAFLAAEMRCARCHDAPFHPFEQADLFGIAGLLAGKPQVIPATSTVPRLEGGRKPTVSVSLKAGDKVEPSWKLGDIAPEALPESIVSADSGSRERLAALLTSPRNSRFAPVLANRLWKRCMGIGLVEPVDDWDGAPAALHPELLKVLTHELVTHDYNLKHLARLILSSRIYQARPCSETASSKAPSVLVAPARRRMSAEQLVDALFAAVGKPFDAEELCLDPDGRRPPTEFLNLGIPRRAWQFASTSNERDRPALSLPVTQSIVDLLETFGWRSSRQDPITDRDQTITPLQPAMLANGVVAHTRIARLSDNSAITALCLLDQPPDALFRSIYLRILSRTPTARETERLVAYVSDTYNGRVIPGIAADPPASWSNRRRVSWSNHLSPEATEIQVALERQVRLGDPTTRRLAPAFRERVEEIVWALFNSPEFVFIP
jgi:hypothetical protein